MQKITELQIKQIAEGIGLVYADLKMIIAVETGGKGFSDDGKLIIQFEPVWFKRLAPYAPSGLWSVNKIDVQSKEWLAFNNAYSLNANKAMQSTSIGLPQIMGMNFKLCGYISVEAMWDDFKKGEFEQVSALARFIKNQAPLFNAIKNKNYVTIADIYNGKGWPDIVKKTGREPYPTSLKNAWIKYSNVKVV